MLILTVSDAIGLLLRDHEAAEVDSCSPRADQSGSVIRDGKIPSNSLSFYVRNSLERQQGSTSRFESCRDSCSLSPGCKNQTLNRRMEIGVAEIRSSPGRDATMEVG